MDPFLSTTAISSGAIAEGTDGRGGNVFFPNAKAARGRRSEMNLPAEATMASTVDYERVDLTRCEVFKRGHSGEPELHGVRRVIYRDYEVCSTCSNGRKRMFFSNKR